MRAETPYHFWTSALSVLCGIDPAADPAGQISQLDAYIQRTCPSKRDRTLPYLCALFGWDQEILPVGGMDLTGSDLQTAIFNAVEIVTTATAAQRPTVWVCEDLHWADPSSIELLDPILRLSLRHPLLIICVMRPDPTCAAWDLREQTYNYGGNLDALEVLLNPLSDAQSELLVGNILGLRRCQRTWSQGSSTGRKAIRSISKK